MLRTPGACAKVSETRREAEGEKEALVEEFHVSVVSPGSFRKGLFGLVVGTGFRIPLVPEIEVLRNQFLVLASFVVAPGIGRSEYLCWSRRWHHHAFGRRILVD